MLASYIWAYHPRLNFTDSILQMERTQWYIAGTMHISPYFFSACNKEAGHETTDYRGSRLNVACTCTCDCNQYKDRPWSLESWSLLDGLIEEPWSLEAKHSILFRSVKNRSVFMTFMQDSSWTLVLYCDLPAFSVEIVLALLALKATPTMNYLNRVLSLVNFRIPGAWLSENILYGVYRAFDTLFPSLFTLAVFLGLEHKAVWSRHPKYVAYHRKDRY